MAKKKTAAKKSKPKPKAKAPRSQTLPGMEQVRNKTLDRICEGISDVRADLNRLRGEEKDLQNQAVRVMTADKVTAYRFSGVELVLVPGDAHLRVRTLKTTANTDQPNADVADAVDEMTGGDE